MIEDNSTTDPVGKLAESFVARYRQGERPSLSEYTAQYPELADRIREVFPMLVLVEEAGSDADGSHEATGSVAAGAIGGGREGPDRIAGYRILREVGRGGMGVVYEAEQLSLGRHVALKVLPAPVGKDPRGPERFRREARAAARLHHTNIVPVFEVGQDRGVLFYAMQYIEGQALDAVLAELKALRQGQPAAPGQGPPAAPTAAAVAHSLLTGRIPAEILPGEENGRSAALPETVTASDVAATRGHETASPSSGVLPGSSKHSAVEASRYHYHRSVAQVGIQVAEALAYAHQEGIVHRDIKPSNLLLDAASRVWVTDFGLAKTDGDALTQTGDILGTLRYMAPERFRGWSDPRTDIYSLGLTLYEMLLLRPAFEAADRLELIRQVTHDEPLRPRKVDPRIPRDLETIVLKAIDKEPSRRYPTADELAADLRRFQEDRPILARRSTLAERAWRLCKRNPITSALAASLLVALVGGLVGVTSQWLRAQGANTNLRETLGKLRETLGKLRDELYVNSIPSARRASDAGDLQLLRKLLDSLRPEPGEVDLRGFEWYYLDHLSRPSPTLLTLKAPTKAAGCVVYNPDGRQIATAGGDHTVRVWDAATGRGVLRFQGHTRPVLVVAYSPDGRRIATGDMGCVVKVWDARTGQVHFTIPAGEGNDGVKEDAELTTLAYSPDGRWIAAGIGQVLKVWSADTGRIRHTLKGHEVLISAVAFSPDGRQLSSVTAPGTIRIWELETGETLKVHSLEAHTDPVCGMAYSPDGRWIATAAAFDQLKLIRIWDAHTGREVRRLQGHTLAVHGVAFSPDGRRLASVSADRTVRIWDADTGQELMVFKGHEDRICAVAFSLDGRRIASSEVDGTVRVWDAVAAQKTSRLEGNTDAVAPVAYSPDGRFLAMVSKDGVVKIWDMSTRRERLTLAGHDYAPLGAYSPDGRRLATASSDGTVRVWDTATGREQLIFRRHTGPVQGVAYSPDGRLIASAGGEGRSGAHCIRVWDAETGEERLQIDGHTTQVRWVAFSPDGRRIVSTAMRDGTVRLWDAKTGQRLFTMNTGSDYEGLAVFSPDGRSLAVPTQEVGTVKVWDAATGQERFTLRGHTGHVWGVAYSPDGRRIASSGTDKTVRIWDAATGRELLVLEGHSDPVGCVAFRRDGRQLVSGGFDTKVRLWDASP